MSLKLSCIIYLSLLVSVFGNNKTNNKTNNGENQITVSTIAHVLLYICFIVFSFVVYILQHKNKKLKERIQQLNNQLSL